MFMKNSKNGKLNIRFYILMRVKLDFDATSIHADFISALGDHAPSYSTVAIWVARFKERREDLEDDERIGRPVDQTWQHNQTSRWFGQ